ncbi:MAG TPA: hypothetical protein VMA13_04575 [Candidatus Saccharimonadales bacterium]|nr:hypothetical protein [Candidatus Saccharimonadales bacterium]
MQPIKCLNRPAWRMWLGAWLGLLLAHASLAASSFAPPDPNGYYNYTIPPDLAPQYDATNFVINNTFTINFATFTINDELYEPVDVVNYTNTGTMAANTGFRFDTQTAGQHQMAGNFINGGSIYCASYMDTNVAFFFGYGLAGLYAGEFMASATNIVNPGLVDVGTDGQMQFTGGNVNLSHGLFTVEAFDPFDLFYNPGLVSVDYGVGTDTNRDWYPSLDLTPTTALSSLFSTFLIPPPFVTQLYLPASTSYFYIAQPATNYIIYRAVFLNNDPGVNVTNNVYFGGDIVGAGAAHIEWVGTYTDPATGLPANNYLYLSDYYLGAANTNNPIIGGIPSNFTFAEGAQEFFGAPAPAGYDPVFSPGVVTNNNYSYVSVLLTPTTALTNNPSPQNVTNYLALQTGRMLVSASQELNLAGADISGPNYLSVSAPNQFDGSPGAQISSPYTDLNLGVTNGFMTVSNLLESALPRWSGAVQAWSSDWIYVDANNVTNDYRVLIVNAQLEPTTAAQVHDLVFHSTNSVVISDVLNIMNKFYIDAPNLTLTTNGAGSASPDGELNLENPAVGNAYTFSSATLPNLRCLTNNGAMRSPNSAIFGGPSPANYTAFVNNGLVSAQGMSVYSSYFENSGTISNSAGSFILQSQTATLTNGFITSGADVSIATGGLVTSNVVIQAGRSLTISATNQLTDTGLTNGNAWTVGSVANNGDSGFNLLANPANGDLLGTAVTNIAPNNVTVVNTWAGRDFGVSTAGFSNNVAIGRLILDSPADIAQPNRYGQFQFNGTGASNAIYVDYLELDDNQTPDFGSDSNGRVYNVLNFNTNLVIYYAQAVINGQSQAIHMNQANDDHLRWVPSYAGYFSSSNIVYPDGTTNAVNAALANDPGVDSDGDGKVNSQDPTPVFVPSQVNFKLTLTNVPPWEVKITWDSIPASTNYVLYSTNLFATSWLVLTDFVSPSAVPPAGGWPITNSVYDTVNPAVQKYYRVHVDPNSTSLYGAGF